MTNFFNEEMLEDSFEKLLNEGINLRRNIEILED